MSAKSAKLASWAIAIGALLLLAGCHKPMTPAEVGAAVAKCKALNLKVEQFDDSLTGELVEIQCFPKE